VQAINRVFSQCDNPFVFAGLEFNPVQPALDAAQGTLVQDRQQINARKYAIGSDRYPEIHQLKPPGIAG
jgi:hypothetical protein